MRIKEIQFYNRAPFENLVIRFDDCNVSILSGVNGVGKTTIISYIVDAFYELAKDGFRNEFEKTSNKFYRVSSGLNILDESRISFVYLRFQEGERNIDYVDVRNLTGEDEYNDVIKIKNNIPYSVIKEKMKMQQVLKYSNLPDKKEIERMFNSQILTYFPAYRYEQPGYLNEPYKISLSFKKETEFAGYLINPIEVTSELPEIANWIMDIVLDQELYKGSTQTLLAHLNLIFTELLSNKVHEQVRLGIGPRQSGATRIQIIKKSPAKQVYPSIFDMSSGELALICMFCELLRQSDRIGSDFSNVRGIVLVDEIDKHLHIRLQKEVLPRLIKIFPNVQFIVTSHSPFFGLGLTHETEDFYRVYDLDNGGILSTPYANELFEEVYNMMVLQNEQFANKYNKLLVDVKISTIPLIITEGKTDWKHLKAAMKALKISDLEVEFYEYSEPMGDTMLLNLLEKFAITSPNRKIIGMFDRDKDDICRKTSKEGATYVELSKNIFVFSIPVVNEEIYGRYTAIEHYYPKEQLLKKDNNGRRLFLGDEFYESGISKCKNYQTRFKGIQNKVAVNGVIDEKVFNLHDDPQLESSIALSKDDFAQMILEEDNFAEGFDFSEFSKIFSIIDEIVNM